MTAVLGLLCGLSVVTLLSHLADIPTAPTLATMIGLAVGIDYSLFIVTKHRTQVAQGMEVHESIGRAIATAGGAVLFAGGTVAISLLALVADIPLVTTLGYTSAIAVFAILGALTLLPALFACSGRTSRRSSCRGPGPCRRDRPAVDQWATGIANHRWPVMIAVLVALLALIPTCRCDSARRTSALSRPTPPRQAYDLITRASGGHERALPDLRPSSASPRSLTRRTSTRSTRTSSCSSNSSRSSSRPSWRGATQQQAQTEAKQQTQKQSNELARRRRRPKTRQPTRASRA